MRKLWLNTREIVKRKLDGCGGGAPTDHGKEGVSDSAACGLTSARWYDCWVKLGQWFRRGRRATYEKADHRRGDRQRWRTKIVRRRRLEEYG